MKTLLSTFLMIACCALTGWGQNTVGVITHGADSLVQPGYNLFFPHNQTTVYLLDNCGRVVNAWEDSLYRPGNAVYIEEDGTLWKCGGNGAASNPWIHAGGGGEVVQHYDWDGTLLWQFTYNDSLKRMHHDIVPMDNGNVLIVAWELIDSATAIAAGRDPNLMPDGEVWPDKIIEVEPVGATGGNIVWEWRAWDHLIQDHDSTKANYGVVADHVELIDVNYDDGAGEADWMHVNAIDYNSYLDQIAISVPSFNEIWIIDHSTTTAHAAGHTGGLAGRGGDLLYRWGNPLAYQTGDSSDIMLGFQHDVHWIDIALPPTNQDFGKLLIFNNRIGGDYSKVTQIFPPWQDYDDGYLYTPGQPYSPSMPDWEYVAPTPTDFYSSGLSGAQRLPNGNTLICSGRQGWTFEITPDETIVWEYINPLVQGVAASQGDVLAANSNIHFRFNRYPDDYAGFVGKDMTPGDYLEMNPDTTFCWPVSTSELTLATPQLLVYPNPVSGVVFMDFGVVGEYTIRITDMTGRLVSNQQVSGSRHQVNTSDWAPGVYLVDGGELGVSKLQVH